MAADWCAQSSGIYWSPECFKICGRAGFHPTPSAVAELVHPQDAARVREEIRAALADRKAHAAEFRITGAGGEVIWISACAQAQYDHARRLICLIGTAQDITERKRAEKDAASSSVAAKDPD